MASRRPRKEVEITVKDGDLKPNSKKDLEMVDLKTLLQYATTSDYMCLGMALVAECGAGTGYPFMMLFFGEALESYGDLCADTAGIKGVILGALHKVRVDKGS